MLHCSCCIPLCGEACCGFEAFADYIANAAALIRMLKRVLCGWMALYIRACEQPLSWEVVLFERMMDKIMID